MLDPLRRAIGPLAVVGMVEQDDPGRVVARGIEKRVAFDDGVEQSHLERALRRDEIRAERPAAARAPTAFAVLMWTARASARTALPVPTQAARIAAH